MDSLSPNNCSKSGSSGSSVASSSIDLGGDKQPKSSSSRSHGQKLSRSRSLLQLLSKHLGRHFQHHHHQNDTVYSSQEDIRSSSTDSFSLSYERGGSGSPTDVINGGSSLDLASSTSPYSRYSPGLDYYTSTNDNTHVYVEAIYQRPDSALEQYDGDCNSSSSSSDDGDDNRGENKPRLSVRAGLHLNRISISSSVNRILQHFSSSNTTSLRSLSCSSTPLHRQLMTKKSLTPHNSNSSTNSTSSSLSSTSSSSKKEKKQQSILRPPVQYVYMKGMSGLYSRVPSYAVCCPYTLHHVY